MWLREQGQLLEQAYIDNVYVFGPQLLALRVRSARHVKDLLLVVEPGRYLVVTSRGLDVELADAKASAPWRAHLRECTIRGVEQYDDERLVELKLRCFGEEKRLVIELLPRGVVAVLDSAGKIVLASRHMSMRDRVIVPGAEYVYPPRRGLTEGSAETELAKRVREEGAVRALVRALGLPPEVAEAAVARCEDADPSKVEDYVKCLLLNAREVVREALESPAPCIVHVDGEAVGFYPFKPPRCPQGQRCRVEELQTLNEAVEAYFLPHLEQRLLEPRLKPVLEEIEKLKKTVTNLEGRIRELEERGSTLRKALEALELHYYDVEKVHECVVGKVRSEGWGGVRECGSLVVGAEPNRGLYRVRVGGVELQLDVTKSLVENYARLRKELAEVEKSVARAAEEKRRLEGEIARLAEGASAETRRVRARVLRRREWYERFHWMRTSSGLLVLGGRDASQNIALIRRFVEPTDIVLHAEIHGASAVVVKSGGRPVSEEDIKEAAVLAACYSKAWNMGLGAVDVFWVHGSQVSLSPPSGEYLPKGGFMVYGKRNYVRGVKLELAVGVEVWAEGDQLLARVIVGPEHLVKERAAAYMVLEPGGAEKGAVAESFIRSLAERGLRDVALILNKSELEREIPGKSRIVRVVMREVSGPYGDDKGIRHNGS